MNRTNTGLCNSEATAPSS